MNQRQLPSCRWLQLASTSANLRNWAQTLHQQKFPRIPGGKCFTYQPIVITVISLNWWGWIRVWDELSFDNTFQTSNFHHTASNSSIAPCWDVPLRVLDPEQKKTGSDGPKARNMSTTPKVFGWELESERLRKIRFLLAQIRPYFSEDFSQGALFFQKKNDINDLQKSNGSLISV